MGYALRRTDSSGIGRMLLSMFLFALADMLAKLVAASYPVNEVAFFRMVFGILPAIAIMMRQPSSAFRPRHLGQHALRAAAALGCLALFYAALPLLPLADAVALAFTEVIFLGLLAVWLLGERVRARSLVCTAAGFAGILLISEPTGDVRSLLGPAMLLASAFCGAVSVIQIKRLSRTESSAAIVFHFTWMSAIASGISLLFWWQTPTWRDLGLMALLGFTAGSSQLCLTAAYRRGSASLLAPYNYTSILWASAWGYLIWGEVPTPLAGLGAALIIGSTAYLGIKTRDGAEPSPPL